MNSKFLVLFVACSVMFLSINAVFYANLDLGMKKKYLIESGSHLFLTGTSNVNSFTCDCRDQWQTQVMEVEGSGDHARFLNTSLQITTKKFDCHNTKIDADMQKALKASAYPYIKIDLLETWQNDNALKSDACKWTDVKTKLRITIAGQSRTCTIQGSGRKLGADRFQFCGVKPLNMSDFGIEPPSALFGMIQVNDEITIHLDLKIALGETLAN